MQPVDAETLDDKKSAARILGVSPDTLDRWWRRGVGPRRIKLPGGLVRYSRVDLMEFIRASTLAGAPARMNEVRP
jgi:predicted DNA-binding transcriptional regulator AlpA